GGMAYALRKRGRDVRVVAASARRARVMWESLQAGRPVEMVEEETLANALSGGIELDNRVTFPLVRDFVDEHVLVDEDAIAGAMAWGWRTRRLLLEGGGAVALAALLKGVPGLEEETRPAVVVLSGGNVSLDVLRRVAGDFS
ncbi:MAG TPA: pyridoxal-phosphate dependent enzyme, partial [Longimicrobiales bacterium]|nr:pyridoxal-phosphate dependent enzyme [Longimicrobiales bacterium]